MGKLSFSDVLPSILRADGCQLAFMGFTIYIDGIYADESLGGIKEAMQSLLVSYDHR